MRSDSARLSSARARQGQALVGFLQGQPGVGRLRHQADRGALPRQPAAKYWRSAASLRLRTRPHRSSSQLLMPMVAL